MLLRFDRSRGFINRNAIAVGDSITSGPVGVTTPWPGRVAADLGVTVYNKGHSGAGWLYDPGGGNLTDRAAAEVYPLVASNPNINVDAFAGTNDLIPALGNSSAAATATAALAYLDGLLGQGVAPNRIYVLTTLPRDGLDDTKRASYNALLVTGATSRGCVLVRLDLDSHIGVNGACNDATYYQPDKTHPNDTGMQVIAGLVEAAMP